MQKGEGVYGIVLSIIILDMRSEVVEMFLLTVVIEHSRLMKLQEIR